MARIEVAAQVAQPVGVAGATANAREQQQHDVEMRKAKTHVIESLSNRFTDFVSCTPRPRFAWRTRTSTNEAREGMAVLRTTDRTSYESWPTLCHSRPSAHSRVPRSAHSRAAYRAPCGWVPR